MAEMDILMAAKNRVQEIKQELLKHEPVSVNDVSSLIKRKKEQEEPAEKRIKLDDEGKETEEKPVDEKETVETVTTEEKENLDVSPTQTKTPVDPSTVTAATEAVAQQQE